MHVLFNHELRDNIGLFMEKVGTNGCVILEINSKQIAIMRGGPHSVVGGARWEPNPTFQRVAHISDTSIDF